MKLKTLRTGFWLSAFAALAVLASCGGGSDAPPATNKPIQGVALVSRTQGAYWVTDVATVDEPAGTALFEGSAITATVSRSANGALRAAWTTAGGVDVEMVLIQKNDSWLSGTYSENGTPSGDARVDVLGIGSAASPVCPDLSIFTLYNAGGASEGISTAVSGKLVSITGGGKTMTGVLSGADLYLASFGQVNTTSFITLYQGTITSCNSATGTWETRTASDNVLDASGSFTLDPSQDIPAGKIVITEMMINPNLIADSAGEWIELYNTDATAWDLKGCILRDAGTDKHVIVQDVNLASGAYATLAISADPGFTPDYVYGNFLLGNSGDEVILECRGNIIDEIDYTNGGTFPAITADRTFSLNPLSMDATSNDNGANWCLSDGTPGAANTGCAAAPQVSVSMSPLAVNVVQGGTQQFAATVTNAADTTVTWSTTGGIISAGGLYTAPNTAGTYTVTATSAQDPAKSASAVVTVPAVAVSVSPASTSVNSGGSAQFTATVTGSVNTAVTWSVPGTGCGTVSATGQYQAPNTNPTLFCTVRATSQADAAKSGSALVTVIGPGGIL